MKTTVTAGLAVLVLSMAPATSHASLIAIGPAVATVSESITPDGSSYIYTYTLQNSDTDAIWWWGVYFPEDPGAVNESNDAAGWVYNGDSPSAQYPFVVDPGPAGWLWTWDARGERPMLTDHKIDPKDYAANVDFQYEFVGQFGSECAAVSAWNQALRESVERRPQAPEIQAPTDAPPEKPS